MRALRGLGAAVASVGLAAGLAAFNSPAPVARQFARLAAVPGTVRVLTLGDSITAPCGDTPSAGYCKPLGALLDNAGQAHVFINEAVGGSDCGYTASNIHTFLTRDLPAPKATDLVLLNCGTNNVPSSQASQDAMGAQWRTIVEAVVSYGVRLAVSFIGYSNPDNSSVFSSNLPNVEATANDVIYRNRALYPSTWFAGLADFQQLPGDLDYLDSGGIHPRAPLGTQREADIWYRALAPTYGWPQIPAPCGMWGHRPGGSPPTFTPCVATS